MNPASPSRPGAETIKFLALIGIVGLITVGCSPKQSSSEAINQTEAIQRLDYRLQQLERRLDQDPSPGPDPGDKTPAGPVKSLTLRLGTVDDRLRIYWGDGSTSNLPCTEEQKTWVCG